MRTAWRAFWRRAAVLLIFIGALWLAHLLNVLLGGALTRTLGLVPRSFDGLDGVLAMPFLHGDLQHLSRNTLPALMLGGLILWQAPDRFWRATLIVVIAGGLLTWLFARPHNHIGASGLIFGWFGFVVALALIERSARGLLGAAVAIAFYGAPALIGLSPLEESVSWDGHLAGLVAGAGAAWVLRERRAPRPLASDY